MTLQIDESKVLCCLIMNSDYSTQESLPLVKNDFNDLRKGFIKRKVQIIPILNANADKVKSVMDRVVDSKKVPKGLIVVFSGHGTLKFIHKHYKVENQRIKSKEPSETMIFSNDSQIETSQLIDKFNTQHAAHLVHIPKIFIFDCCRGSNELNVSLSTTKAPKRKYTERISDVELDDFPLYNNCLIIRSQLRGYVSGFVMQHSSLIRGIVKELDTEETNFYNILHKAKLRMRDNRCSGNTLQNPEVTDYLFENQLTLQHDTEE